MNAPALLRCAIAVVFFLITAGLIAFALYKYHLTGDWATELEWIYRPSKHSVGRRHDRFPIRG
jgi:hypothetical protein